MAEVSTKTVPFSKAVRSIMEDIPGRNRMSPVQGAAVIGLHVVEKDGLIHPSVQLWSGLPLQAVQVALKEVLASIEKQLEQEQAQTEGKEIEHGNC